MSTLKYSGKEVRGVSEKQKEQLERFAKASKSVDCPNKEGMAKNKCRVEKIGKLLEK